MISKITVITKRFSLLFLLALSISSCGDNNSSADDSIPVTKKQTLSDSLFHEVMEGHDEGMARMGRIRRYAARIQQMLDSVSKLPEEKTDKLYQKALQDIREDLDYADYSMNTWMEEFKLDSAKSNDTARIKYLLSEKEKVNKVRDNIMNSLGRADSLFNEK